MGEGFAWTGGSYKPVKNDQLNILIRDLSTSLKKKVCLCMFPILKLYVYPCLKLDF